ncbi:hypothetical protein DPMN_048980 [Dreissena polymorpha]|uniref:Uncharacterized protein n=1 Tax=Dreissena polymorpha TaxID=45954 RepID=A0A9D4DAZ2_DREPO|nr:hypothetical protein DPMN_048980 [Dreissena polymorpha]
MSLIHRLIYMGFILLLLPSVSSTDSYTWASFCYFSHESHPQTQLHGLHNVTSPMSLIHRLNTWASFCYFSHESHPQTHKHRLHSVTSLISLIHRLIYIGFILLLLPRVSSTDSYTSASFCYFFHESHPQTHIQGLHSVTSPMSLIHRLIYKGFILLLLPIVSSNDSYAWASFCYFSHESHPQTHKHGLHSVTSPMSLIHRLIYIGFILLLLP